MGADGPTGRGAGGPGGVAPTLAPSARCLGAAAALAWAAAAALPGASPPASPAAPGPSSRAPGSPSDTIVDGFHGHRFGTPGRRIREIDLAAGPDSRHGGLDVYVRDLHFLGAPTRAYFYLDSARHRLRRGKHLMEPEPSSCVRQLRTLRLMLADTYPEIEVRLGPGSGAADTAEAPGGRAPAPRCSEFLEAGGERSRVVRLLNPRTGAEEARLELFRRGGEPRILACYLLTSDCAWPDSVEVRPGPRILAPGRGPDTADARRDPRPNRRSSPRG